MKRQSCIQENEIIELREGNVEESEADCDKPPNAQTRKVGISLAPFILTLGKIPHSKRNDTAGTSSRGGLVCCLWERERLFT